MRRVIVLCFLLLATTAASAAQTWAISAQQPCTGLTAGFARPLVELNRLLAPRWQAAPGPVKDQGLVLVFVTACPNSTIAGKPSGAFDSAFVLVPVVQGRRAKKQTHAIAILQVAGRASTPAMKLFRGHDIPVSDANVSLELNAQSRQQHAEAIIHFAGGTLTLTADMRPQSAPFKSADTTAVRVQPAGTLFSGPEASMRYTNGTAQMRATADTWVQDYGLGQPVFVTLDTDFRWNFVFATPSAQD